MYINVCFLITSGFSRQSSDFDINRKPLENSVQNDNGLSQNIYFYFYKTPCELARIMTLYRTSSAKAICCFLFCFIALRDLIVYIALYK